MLSFMPSELRATFLPPPAPPSATSSPRPDAGQWRSRRSPYLGAEFQLPLGAIRTALFQAAPARACCSLCIPNTPPGLSPGSRVDPVSWLSAAPATLVVGMSCYEAFTATSGAGQRRLQAPHQPAGACAPGKTRRLAGCVIGFVRIGSEAWWIASSPGLSPAPTTSTALRSRPPRLWGGISASPMAYVAEVLRSP